MQIVADGKPIKVTYAEFPNQEQRVKLGKSVSGVDCTVIESLMPCPDARLVRLLLTIDALKENGAKRVKAVVPYLAYSLQDKYLDQEAISAKVVANAISGSGVDEIELVDVHSETTLKYFSVPVKNLSTSELFAGYLQKTALKVDTVVAPDRGARERASALAKLLGKPLVCLTKKRDQKTLDIAELEVAEGKVGKTVVVVDDAINSGRTVAAASRYLRAQGAEKVIWCVSHFLNVPGSRELILPEIEMLVTTDSVEHGLRNQGKIVILPLTFAVT